MDAERIGATGASGGGNQTMWLAALDDRVQAAMPVVSVGTFQSYVARSNCICELLPDGLTFTEEAGVLALTAPRALKICNCLHDSNPTFYPSEMLRSFKEARKVYRAMEADDKLSYQIFNLQHGYWPEIREAMLGWFDLHLKGEGTGAPRAEVPFETLPEEKVMVFATGKRPPAVQSIAAFCKLQGDKLHAVYSLRSEFTPAAERDGLASILRRGEQLELQRIVEYGTEQGWEKLAIQTKCDRLIPLLVRRPQSASGKYLLLGHPQGKKHLADTALLRGVKPDTGLILADFWGHGETCQADSPNEVYTYRLLSRGALWLGKTVLGEWVREWDLLRIFAHTNLGGEQLRLGGAGNVGMAALFSAALGSGVEEVLLEKAAPGYRFAGNTIPDDNFSMASHLPGFLCWGDVSLAAALAETKVRFISPLRMDGTLLSQSEISRLEAEYAASRSKCSLTGSVSFEI